MAEVKAGGQEHLPSKTPGTSKDYTVYVGEYLKAGDTVTAQSATVAGSPSATASIPTYDAATETITTWIGGGLDGETIECTVKFSTQSGIVDEEMLLVIPVKATNKNG